MTASSGRWAAFALLLLLVTGCAGMNRPAYTLVEPRVRPIDDFYTVEPGIAWTSWSKDKIEAWTIDGYELQRLRFFKGVAEGEPIFPAGKDAERRPRFRTAMTPSEIAEYVVESIFGARILPTDVRPATFGGVPGFRCEVLYHTRDGVNRQGLVAGAVVKNKLHVIVYDGVRLHHFGKYRADAERVIDSVKLK